MTKGKSHARAGRGNWLRADARMEARRARRAARRYDMKQYDKPTSGDAIQ